MGVGDRHSRSTAATLVGKKLATDPNAAPAADAPGDIVVLQKRKPDAKPAPVVADQELDDAFSAWDEDDAFVARPTPAAGAQKTVTHQIPAPAPPTPGPQHNDVTREVKVEVPPLARAVLQPIKLVDPVVMRDIVISRAPTIDDPMTTRVLAEIARADAAREKDVVPEPPVPPPVPPPLALPGDDELVFDLDDESGDGEVSHRPRRRAFAALTQPDELFHKK